MGNVIELRRKVAARTSNTAAMLADLTAKEQRGELHGMIHIIKTDEGTSFGVNGEYSERLQFAGYALIKGLNAIADKIAESGSSGYTAAGPIRETWPAVPPIGGLPRRLRDPYRPEFG